MNCPSCLKSNSFQKLFLINDYYVCEGNRCVFFERKVDFEKTYANKSELIEMNENENLSKSSVIHEQNSKLTVDEQVNNENFVQVDEILEDTCYEISNSSKGDTNRLNSDLSNELTDMSTLVENVSTPVSEHSSKFLHTTTVKQFHTRITNTVEKISSDFIDENIEKSFNLYFLKGHKKLFNWIRMPYFMKTHSKIVRILLLHLNIFKFRDSAPFDQLKSEYSLCEIFANQFPFEEIKDYCYRFLHKLYEIVESIPNKNLIEKEMDERVICLLGRLFSRYDSTGRLKFETNIEISCSFCQHNQSVNSNEYLISIERSKTQLKISKNKISYCILCLKCKGKLRKTITFSNIPEFVILHFPKGMKESIENYKNLVIENNGKNISMVAVIESGSRYPFSDFPETSITFDQYKIAGTEYQLRNRPSYCVHFRNTNGWYGLNNYKPYICAPTENPSAICLSEVRFLVFGSVSGPTTYDGTFSLKNELKKMEEVNCEWSRNCFKCTEIDLPKEGTVDVKLKKKPKKRKQPSQPSSSISKQKKSLQAMVPKNLSVDNTSSPFLSSVHRSSAVSPASSLFGEEKALCSNDPKMKKSLFEELNCQFQNRALGIDDLINRQSEKVNMKQ